MHSRFRLVASPGISALVEGAECDGYIRRRAGNPDTDIGTFVPRALQVRRYCAGTSCRHHTWDSAATEASARRARVWPERIAGGDEPWQRASALQQSLKLSMRWGRRVERQEHGQRGSQLQHVGCEQGPAPEPGQGTALATRASA